MALTGLAQSSLLLTASIASGQLSVSLQRLRRLMHSAEAMRRRYASLMQACARVHHGSRPDAASAGRPEIPGRGSSARSAANFGDVL
jgi:hypothetical protein